MIDIELYRAMQRRGLDLDRCACTEHTATTAAFETGFEEGRAVERHRALEHVGSRGECKEEICRGLKDAPYEIKRALAQHPKSVVE
jgi:hypothetical protein